MLNGIGSSLSWNQIRYGDQSNQGTSMTQASQAGAAGGRNTATITQSGSSSKVDTGECQTCKERKYQDGSSDMGVSFKSATALSPGEAFSRVSAHEQEHVFREQAKANAEGREVVSQSVRIKTDICPECGRNYVSGGETRTVTKSQSQSSNSQLGNLVDAYA